MTAERMITQLALQPHPEGGWYRETWRAEAADGQRGLATSILFLLRAGERSHWHRVDATELWIFQAGRPLTLRTYKDGPVVETVMGSDPGAGHALQHAVEPHEWQAADGPDEGWSLVACVVTPAFEFSGFELAPPDWRPPT